jgi:hypothetical protein
MDMGYSMNKRGGYYKIGVAYGLDKKMSVAMLYFGTEPRPSIRSLAIGAKVSRGFARTVLEDLNVLPKLNRRKRRATTMVAPSSGITPAATDCAGSSGRVVAMRKTWAMTTTTTGTVAAASSSFHDVAATSGPCGASSSSAAVGVAGGRCAADNNDEEIASVIIEEEDVGGEAATNTSSAAASPSATPKTNNNRVAALENMIATGATMTAVTDELLKGLPDKESSTTARKSSRLARNRNISSKKMNEIENGDSDANHAKLESRAKRAKSVLQGGDESEDGKTSRTTVGRSRQKSTSSPILAAHKKRLDELLKGLPDTPNVKYYEEESAWRFCNPKLPEEETKSNQKVSPENLTELRGGGALPSLSVPVSPNDLPPLPPAAPMPTLPNTRFCYWSFDEESRVLFADFRVSSCRTAEEEGEGGGRCGIKIVREDEVFLFTMMERDDITVISQGLADEINSSLWSREYIEGVTGSVYHHKFRAFETMFREDGSISEQTREKEGWYSMKFADYFQYLDRRRSVKHRLQDTSSIENGDLINDFTFIDIDGHERTVNVDTEAIVRLRVTAYLSLSSSPTSFKII